MREKLILSLSVLMLAGAAKFSNASDSDVSQQIQMLNSQIQAQMQKMQADGQEQLKTLNKQLQAQIKKVQTDLQAQIQQVNNQTQQQLKQMQAGMAGAGQEKPTTQQSAPTPLPPTTTPTTPAVPAAAGGK